MIPVINGVNQKLETALIVLWDKYSTVLKLWQFVMTETYESWLSLENSCIYYVRQNHEIYQVLPYTVDFRAPQERERDIKFISLCGGTEDIGVHIVHMSRVIITYTLE